MDVDRSVIETRLDSLGDRQALGRTDDEQARNRAPRGYRVVPLAEPLRKHFRHRSPHKRILGGDPEELVLWDFQGDDLTLGKQRGRTGGGGVEEGHVTNVL